MMLIRLLPTLAAIAVLSGCAAQRKPLPAPPPPTPAPVAAATPAPPPVDWRDAAQTPGDWRYVRIETSVTHSEPPAPKTAAIYAGSRTDELFALTCERGVGRVRLSVSGPAEGGEVPLTITTSSIVRTFSGSHGADGWLTLLLSPRDPVLDAMAFSRGRFVIEVAGLPALYLPAWPEVGRVIEDCR